MILEYIQKNQLIDAKNNEVCTITCHGICVLDIENLNSLQLPSMLDIHSREKDTFIVFNEEL